MSRNLPPRYVQPVTKKPLHTLKGWQVEGCRWQVSGRLGDRIGEADSPLQRDFRFLCGRCGNFFKKLYMEKREKLFREKKRRVELTIGTTCHTCHAHAGDPGGEV